MLDILRNFIGHSTFSAFDIKIISYSFISRKFYWFNSKQHFSARFNDHWIVNNIVEFSRRIDSNPAIIRTDFWDQLQKANWNTLQVSLIQWIWMGSGVELDCQWWMCILWCLQRPSYGLLNSNCLEILHEIQTHSFQQRHLIAKVHWRLNKLPYQSWLVWNLSIDSPFDCSLRKLQDCIVDVSISSMCIYIHEIYKCLTNNIKVWEYVLWA